MDRSEAVDPLGSAARLPWVDAARGIAIVLVVLLHSRDWLRTAGLGMHAWDATIEVMNGLRMPVFFTLSGLLGARWLASGWPGLISGKVTPLAWVYLLWQPIGSLTAIVASQITGGHLHATRMLVSLAATPLRPRFELWFLWALVVMFVGAKLGAGVRVRLQLVLAGAVSAVFFSTLVHEGNLGWYGVPKYYVFFLLGAYHRTVVEAFVDRCRRSPTLVAGVLGGWAASAVLVYATGLDAFIGPDFVSRVLGLGAALALAVLASRWHLLTYLGARTLPIYLAHTPLIIVLAYLADEDRRATWMPRVAPILPVVLTLLVIPLALGLHELLLRTPARHLYGPPRAVTELVLRLRRPRVPLAVPAPAPRPAPAAPSGALPTHRKLTGRAQGGRSQGGQSPRHDHCDQP